jgi:hypothetical protein
MREARRDTLRTFLDADGARPRCVPIDQSVCDGGVCAAAFVRDMRPRSKKLCLSKIPTQPWATLPQWWSRIEHDRSVAAGI